MRLGGTQRHFQLHVLEVRGFQEPLNVQETREKKGRQLLHLRPHFCANCSELQRVRGPEKMLPALPWPRLVHLSGRAGLFGQIYGVF